MSEQLEEFVEGVSEGGAVTVFEDEAFIILTIDGVYVIDPRSLGSDAVVTIKFQKGPMREVGLNGIHMEHLLEIVAHRLCEFQKTEWKCDENGMALSHIYAAINKLNQRTDRRIAAGTEGTSTV